VLKGVQLLEDVRGVQEKSVPCSPIITSESNMGVQGSVGRGGLAVGSEKHVEAREPDVYVGPAVDLATDTVEKVQVCGSEARGQENMKENVGESALGGADFAGPILHFGPVTEFCGELPEVVFTNVGTKVQEVGRANSHVRFVSKDSDLSDFNDSVEDFREEQERKVLHKAKHKQKKRQGGGKAPLMGNLSLVHIVDLVKGGRSRVKKSNRDGVKSGQEGVPKVVCGREEVSKEKVDAENFGNKPGKLLSPSSGLKLILGEEDGNLEPETPCMLNGGDPLKKVEASSLYGIQNGLGFSFTTPEGANKDRLEDMEVVDVEKKVVREQGVVYQ
jgi:hypothetical protein